MCGKTVLLLKAEQGELGEHFAGDSRGGEVQ